MKKEVIGIDYETTGFGAYTGDKIFAFCITTEDDVKTKVWRFDWKSRRKRKTAEGNFNYYHTNKFIKVAHNAKFEQNFTAAYYGGTLPNSEWRDTMIMSQMLRNLLMSHSLENLAKRYFTEMFPEKAEEWTYYDKQVKLHVTKQKRLMNNYPRRVEPEILEPIYDDGVNPFVIDRPNYGLVPVDIMTPYQVADGDRCILLYKLMWPKLLDDKAMYNDFMNEMDLIKVTQRMEQNGIMVHVKNAKVLQKELSGKVAILKTKKKKYFGFDINLDSSDQLQKHLFGYINRKKHEKIKVDEEWKRQKPRYNMIIQIKTATGTPSASKEALALLQKAYPDNPAVDLLSQWRAFSRGCTMVTKYMELMNEKHIIHANIKTNEAATGRESISQPSLQNVQKEFSIKSIYGIPARRCFRPRPGYVYFLGDYSGIEMRMIINAANETVLIDELKKDNDFDVHTFISEVMLQEEFTCLPPGKEKKALRAHVKDADFGIPYGASVKVTALSLQKSVPETKQIIRNFAEVCPGICTFNRTQMDKVRSKGYITTAFGRKLYIFKDKAYTAANYQIQGDAAGAFKRGQNNIDKYLHKVWNDEIKMILPVHDEIIIEFPRYLLSDSRAILHDLNWCMINIPEIEVPLMTEWKIATTNWQDAEEIEI